MRRRFRPAQWWWLIALAVHCSCTRQPPSESVPEAAFSRERPRKISFHTDWFPQAEHGGFYQALAKGFYAEAGLDVTLLAGGPGSNIKLKVARGDVDLGMDRGDNLILAIAKENLPLVMVATVTQHDHEALLLHADSPVKSFADLNGRTISASPGQAWIEFLKKRHGITFNLVPTKGGLGAFLGDKEAIQQCVFTNEPFIARQHGVPVRILVLADAGYDMYTAIFCRRDFALAHPAATRAFLAATLRGWRDYLEGDPAPAHAEILRRNPSMTAEFLTFSRQEMIRHNVIMDAALHGQDLGRIDPVRLSDQINTLVGLKLLPAAVAPAAVTTAEFLPSVVR